MRSDNLNPRFTGLAVAALILAWSSPAAAQRREPEFTKQALLVPNFSVDSGVDMRAGKRAGDDARDAAKDRINGREAEVIGSYDIAEAMTSAGYKATDIWLESDIRSLGTALRADEYVLGHVHSDGRNGPVRVSGTLVLMRDPRMRQPLPTATGRKLEDAARQVGAAAAAARAQLVHLRRCENALRAGERQAALQAARAGIAAYPQATLARTCLVWALRATGAAPAQVLATSREILAVDSMNVHAIENAAIALDSLGRNRESAPLWLRLARTDSFNLELAERVINALQFSGSIEEAERFAIALAKREPGHLPFHQYQWRLGNETKHWDVAIAAGEVLLQRDSAALADPSFFRRLAAAYQAAGRKLKALEITARGVDRFPDDMRLYALYTQYVKQEADTVLPRGLALFPKSGELLALHARELRARGQVAEAAVAIRDAVSADSTLPDGPLMVAQAEFDVGRPDSALAALRRALATGTDSARVAQFALARGNALYRAAQGTKRSGDFALGLQFIALADSVRSTPQARLLLGMTALGSAQAAFTEAVAEKDRDRAKACELARIGAGMLPVARTSLESGRAVAEEAATQGLAYVDQLEPYSQTALKGLCDG